MRILSRRQVLELLSLRDARRAIVDVPTLCIGLAVLGITWRFKIPEPLLIAAGAAAGLIIVSLR
jgi:hypothetical protein